MLFNAKNVAGLTLLVSIMLHNFTFFPRKKHLRSELIFFFIFWLHLSHCVFVSAISMCIMYARQLANNILIYMPANDCLSI